MRPPNPIRTLLALRRNDRATRKALEAFRTRHLRALVEHAYRNVPYYRALFDGAGLRPEDIQSPADLSAVPITTRETLQDIESDAIVARGVDPQTLFASSSSGATGTPVTIRRTWVENRLLGTIRARAFSGFGLRSSDRIAALKTLSVTRSRDRSASGRLLAALRRDRWKVIDSRLSSHEVVAQLRDHGTTVLSGYPSTLLQLTDQVDTATLHTLGLRLVSAGGEVLGAEPRERIEAAFGARVQETYGSTEFDLIASECAAGHGLHVSDDGLILEIETEGTLATAGQAGEMLGTCLHSYAMPLIRYTQGDLVERRDAQCRCGSPFSTLGHIQGRVVDLFALPNGERVHPYEIFVPIRQRFGWIRRFDATQHAVDHLTMRVLTDAAVSDEDEAGLRAMVAEHFGHSLRFDLELLRDPAALHAAPGSKFQMYRSRVTSRSRSDPR